MRSSRRYLYLGLFVLLAVGAWTGFWFYLAGKVRDGIDAWVAQQEAQGIQVAYTDLSISGYPYRIEVVAQDITVAGPNLPGKGALAVPRLTVLSLPWNPRLVVAGIEGEVLFRWTDPKGAEQRATYKAASTGISVGFADGKPDRFAFSGDRPVVTATTLAAPVTAKVFEIHARRLDGGAAPAAGGAAPTAPLLGELAIDGEAIRLPPDARNPLGPEIDRLALTVGLAGPLPPVAPGQNLRTIVDAWARGGGTVELTRGEVKWGSLNLTLTGSFAVDREMRPMGAISGRIGGLEPLIDAAVAEGRLNDGQARSIKQALGAIGFIARDQEGRVPVSATLQDGRIMVGPVPVGELQPIF
ncbi:DUF2125 domain-containing protein [Zavarzinia compransoris]|uniref:DUF2125 domain-containing protein n=1 Tax=Zavarzinia compransoris TaxID=1264899 RepID=UPI0010F0FF7D|nr:DUF2125 domain-containing protein [Zavarzinia compransoris]TDP48919.1 hypothetical protein DES42_101279 [Zavarzinia compransoris]